MKISIITACFNSETTIKDTIVSVMSQRENYPNIEYVVIDGVSKDQTLEILNQHLSEIDVLVSEKDRGIYDAMNKGIQQATGDVIGILNSDDFYMDDQVIKDIANQFQTNKFDAVYADLVYVDQEKTENVVRYWKSGEYAPGKFIKGWMPPHPTLFVKKQVYDRYGAFNLDFKTSADYELMLRLIHKEKINVGYLPRVIVKMRTGGQSNVSITNRLKGNREDRKAWEINSLKPGLFTALRKPLSKLSQYFRKKVR